MIRKILRIILKTYFWIAAFIGTVVMAHPFIVILWNALLAPAPTPIFLPNGFVYDSDWEPPGVNQAIYNNDLSEKIIAADVKRIMWHENAIYGYRQGLAKEGYYFLCIQGKNCDPTQHYREDEFVHLLQEKDLPPFSYNESHSYDELLRKKAKDTSYTK